MPFKTFDYLTDPFFLPGVAVGFAVAATCSVLSVPAVLKRMSFAGQGISHAAFGGIGLAAAIGLVQPSGGQFAVVLTFCFAAALLVAWLSDRRTLAADTAIGIVLVASMALGAILLQGAFDRARLTHTVPPPGWESILFGQLSGVAWPDAAFAWAIAGLVILTLWAARRPLLFWAFDEPVAAAYGVRSALLRAVLMLLLTLAIVASMKLAGVILATALLVLPGAAALQLSRRLYTVFALSLLSGVLGVAGGLVLSFEIDWPPGPAIVAVLAALFAVARAVSAARVLRRH